MNKVRILGAGFSGLTLAWYLTKKNIPVVIYEKASRPGGLIQTTKHKGMLSESAAHGIMWSENVEELFQDLDLKMCLQQKLAKKRFIWRSEPRQWPLNPFESIELVSKFLPKMVLNKSKLKPRPQQSLFQWGESNLGKGATRYLLSPAIQGIYAGDPQQLSASLILGRLFEKKSKRSKYRGTVAPLNGMGEIIQALEKKLTDKGVEIHCNSAAELTNWPGPQVIATSAAEAGRILSQWSGKDSVLDQIEMLPVLTVTVGFEKVEKPLQGFGMLFPRDSGFRVLGILSNTFVFEGRGPQYNETWIFGGAHDPRIMELSDQEVHQLIQEERKKIFSDSSQPTEMAITRWNQGLPHYTLKLESLLPQIQVPPGVYLTGNYLGGVGLSQILDRNQALAERLAHG